MVSAGSLFAQKHPAGEPNVCTYLAGHDAVFAVIDVNGGQEEPRVYSLEHNTWAPLPTEGIEVKYAGPYGQVVYVAKYGVLVSVRQPNAVLRPDLAEISGWNSRTRADGR